MRVVLDTDVMVAALRSATRASRTLLLAGIDRRLTLVVSATLLFEYESVLKRPEHLAAACADESDVDVVLDQLVAAADAIETHYLWRPQLTDGGDELVPEAAVNGRADALVTFNLSDFDGPAQRFGLRLCRPSDLLRSL